MQAASTESGEMLAPPDAKIPAASSKDGGGQVLQGSMGECEVNDNEEVETNEMQVLEVGESGGNEDTERREEGGGRWL